jgi:AbrB family looped-hinge helix DNA binding protein
MMYGGMTVTQEAIVRNSNMALVQEKGQVTIPASFRRKYGIDKGDYVAFVDTGEGILITRREVVATELMDEIGRLLSEKGITLEELMESGAKIREEIVGERYGSKQPPIP